MVFVIFKEEIPMKKRSSAFLLFVIVIFLLGGCSASFEEEISEALIAVENDFNESPKEANNENKDIQYYLPFGFELEEESPNNLILKNGSKTYILFYNLQEGPNSEVVLHATLQQKEFNVDKRFTDKEKLGYFLVKKLNDSENELTVGIGGVKVTSEVKTKNLKSEAEYMMRIANSVTAQ